MNGSTTMTLRRLATLSLVVAAACTNTETEEPQGGDGAGAGGAGIGGAPNAGAGGGEATGGTGGGTPTTIARADKVDLLFVVDNSASMADKQQVLGIAVRDLLSRLTNPLCIDQQTGTALPRGQQPGAATDPCPGGSLREFPPTHDIHVGVISSSLGGHGADSCSSTGLANNNPRQEDMARLLTRGPGGTQIPTYQGLGYLNWDPDQKDNPPGEADFSALAQRFGDIVLGAGQDGCGFEASLESWYRFLVDPAPYQVMAPAPCFDGDTSMGCREPQGVDEGLLDQRAGFLRPDSAVAIVMLTDENDCSVKDTGQNYLALQAFQGSGQFHLARGTTACETDPTSPECKSCWEVELSEHPECQQGWANPELDDPINLRCYRQRQRFGIDFLQPVQRYVDGLTRPTFDDGNVNPLFCSSPSADGKSCDTAMRDPSLVVMTGIVGVPWQDLARNPADLNEGYQAADALAWDVILGDPSSYQEPGDPLMRESIEPRTGASPVTGEALTPPGALPANSINGGEWAIETRNDLQHACTFALPQPLDCQDPAQAFGCDCADGAQNPLCRNPATQGYGTTQFAAKAYPGSRQLEVLKGLGAQAVVASICPANLTDNSRSDFGYRPAMAALGDRLRANLK